MNPILLVVLSVLATLSVVFLVWTVDGLRKAQKANLKSQEQITALNLAHDDTHRKIDKTIDILSDNLSNVESSLQDDIRRHNEDTHLAMDSRFRDLESDLDRRFDKLYAKLYREFPQLKETKQDAIEQINS